MNCLNVKAKFVEYLENLLPEEEKRQMAAHLETCPDCSRALASVSEIRARLLHAGRDNKSADFEHRVIDKIIREQNRRLKQAGGIRRQFEKWRYIMKTRTAKLSAAAVAAFALIFGIGILTNIPSSATADTFLSQAMDALSGLSSIHMEARMRSRLGDNFGSICLECDFVSVEMWKQVDDEGTLRWRLEKPVRTIVMDGETTTMVAGDKWATRIEEPRPLGCCFDSWMGRLLDVRGLLDSELQQATTDPVRQFMLHHEEINGKDKIFLEIDVTTEVPENDVMRDSWLENSEHIKVYQFDAATKQLEGFQVFVISNDAEVLAFEITSIEYNAQIDTGLFALELPADIIWDLEPEILPDNDMYRNMTAAEAAAAFMQAVSDKNRTEVLKFLSVSSFNEEDMGGWGNIESFSIGTPFQSESDFPGWFIPYEVEMKNGLHIKGRLAMRNDNNAGRFVISGNSEEVVD